MGSGGRTQSQARFRESVVVRFSKPIIALSKIIITPEATARRYRPARLVHVLYVGRFTRVISVLE